MTAFSIGELVIPASIDAPDAGDFIEMTRVRNRVGVEVTGCSDLAVRPDELLPSWHAQAFEEKRMLVARVEGRIVARAVIELPLGTPLAWIAVEVLRRFRRHGIGSALYERVESMAAAARHPVLQGFVIQGASDSVERIVAPTGFGSVARDDDGSRFLLARGFALEQVARMSRLGLPADRSAMHRLFVRAAADAGVDYRMHYWTGRTPPEHLLQIADLRGRLATDAPQGGLEPDTSAWTVDRVRAEDDYLEASPRTRLTALVEYQPTGEAAGYTELDVPAEPSRAVTQGDTIVLQEHRGHRLGMLLKTANLLRLGDLEPRHPSVLSFAAEENRHMLQLNDALGFVPWGYEGAWKKVLS
ncbi:GNAT family N-acetyltransferase [Conyzicola nivalis]|uniref:GNAT family N-acetyltransferase n=1 Tax=Conyzicola nivalis TaxID=1477021 RepID=A0A916WHB5_9MICO|nr:GNAT family N-acetyltransferase [Conyzicola nivalis]GGB01229.1 GNAT family N-acetyltransferase [Conyzicola nivalis]